MNPELHLLILMDIRDGKKITDIAKDIKRCQQIVTRYLKYMLAEGEIEQDYLPGEGRRKAKHNSRRLTEKGRKVLIARNISIHPGGADFPIRPSGDGAGEGQDLRTSVPIQEGSKSRIDDSPEMRDIRHVAEVTKKAVAATSYFERPAS